MRSFLFRADAQDASADEAGFGGGAVFAQADFGFAGDDVAEGVGAAVVAACTSRPAGIAGAQANLADETALRRAFADAQARITRPTRIALATHYFRTEWVSHLGATNAWLIMALRSRCYWNKESGELRDTCVMSMQELADLLGTSTRTVIRGLQDPLVRRFASAQERIYERRASDGRKGRDLAA